MIEEFLLSLPGELYSSLIIIVCLSVVVIILGKAFKKADPLKPSKGLACIGEILVSTIDNFVNDNMGKNYEMIKPYFITLTLLVPSYFFAGLIGLPAPMTYLSIPLTLALVTSTPHLSHIIPLYLTLLYLPQ